MREYITPARIANQVRMTRTQFAGSFLMVEGSTDGQFYGWLVNPDQCKIVIAHNKANAISALDLLENDGFPGVLVIVDADFDFLEGRSPHSPNLLFTDTHDLETMIIKSPAFKKVLGEFGSAEKISQFVQKRGKDVLTALIECSKPVGYLRWVSLQEGLSLKFEELDFGKFVSKETLNIDVLKLIRLVQSRSHHSDRDKSQVQMIADNDIQQKMQQLKNDTYDPWHVCCGHDLVSVLSFGLCKALGSRNTGDVKIDVLERSLRLAYERAYFQQTRLYASIQQWERANMPFVILKMT